MKNFRLVPLSTREFRCRELYAFFKAKNVPFSDMRYKKFSHNSGEH
jgi:hypothetical protein